MHVFKSQPIFGLTGFFCLVISFVVADTATADDVDPTLPVLTWQHGDITNTDGQYTLAWSPVPVDGGYDFVRIEVRNPADDEAQWGPRFVTGSSHTFASYVQGERLYRLRACVLTEDGGESCGAFSDIVSATSTAAVETARVVQLKSDLPEPDPAQSSSGPGGAAAVYPGHYVVESKRRMGWFLNWVNDLRCKPNNPDNCVTDNVNQLWVQWTTYRDFSGNTPGEQNLQPVWLMGALRKNDQDPTGRHYTGNLYYFRIHPTTGATMRQDIGNIEILHGNGDSLRHTVRWEVDDPTFYKDGDKRQIEDTLDHSSEYFGIGVPLEDSDIDQFQGWWLAPTGTHWTQKFTWATYITGDFEFGVLAFFDDNGEPIWGAAQYGGYEDPAGPQPLLSSETNYCLYTVTNGWYPDAATPENHPFNTVSLQNGTCTLHPGDGQGTGWNLRRKYGPLEADDPGTHGQPGTMALRVHIPDEVRGEDAKRTLFYGDYWNPGIMHKWVSNHMVRYFLADDPDSPNPGTCEMEGTPCQYTVDWFSDGHYPDATLYLFEKSGGAWSLADEISGWPEDDQFSVQGYPYEISESGIYRFELRRDDSSSQLIAFSRDFHVTGNAVPGELAITPDSVDFGMVLDSGFNEFALRSFEVGNDGPPESVLEIALDHNSVQGTGFSLANFTDEGYCRDGDLLSGSESCEVVVLFWPHANGLPPNGPTNPSYDGTLTVVNALNNDEATATLSGTVVESCAATAGVSSVIQTGTPGELPELEFLDHVLADTPGIFELAWTDLQSGTHQPEIYMLARVSLDGPDQQPTVHYMREPQARVVHYQRGTWRYTVRACRFDGQQRRCGPPSEPLIVDAGAGPVRGRQPVPRSELPEPPDQQTQSSPPSLLDVGQYKSGLTRFNGWHFSWDSLLRDENNPQDVFELTAVWATYRDFSYDDGPSDPEDRNLQPVWLIAEMLPEGDDVYSGHLIYSTVENGALQESDIGTVTICLDGPDEGKPRVEWRVTDPSFYEGSWIRTVIDDLEVIYDPDANGHPDTNEIDHYQGLWEAQSASGPLNSASMFTYIIGNLETNLLTFWDDDGKPIWGTSMWGGFSDDTPAPQTAVSFCVYGVLNGWYPDVPYPDGQSPDVWPYAWGSGCNPDGSAPGWNLRREFDDLEPGIDQSGGLSLGVYVQPMFRGEEIWRVEGGVNNLPPMEKAAGFHGIRYSIDGFTDLVACVLSQEGGNCDLVLRWFTGGDYENARLFVRRDGGSPVLVEDSEWENVGDRSRVNFHFSVNDPGSYSFELRTNTNPTSRLLAISGELEVEPGCDIPPGAWSPGPPSGTIAVPPDDPLTPTFQWNHNGATEYDLQVWRQGETEPLIDVTRDGNSYQPAGNPGFSIGGTYEWQVTARNDQWCGGISVSDTQVFEFVLNCTLPPNTLPSLSQPVSEMSEHDMPPTFVWKGVGGAEIYHLRVWKQEDEDEVLVNVEIDVDDNNGNDDTSYVPAPGIDWQMHEVYEWQITAKNDEWCGGDVESDVIEFNFSEPTVSPDIPPTPVLDPDFNIEEATELAASSRIGATPGEFRVDESGAANYRIPIMTVPGSGGVAPEISLNYNSYGGRGPLGQGWSLSGFSTISRCSQTIEQDGATTGIRLDDQDRFCLDGQKLMLVPGTGAYGASGSQYRLEIDDFSRITAHGNLNGSPTHFEVRRKDGSLSTYGTSCPPGLENCSPSPSARVLTKGDDPVVFAWPISRFEDSVGNFIEYLYDHPDPGWIEWVPLAVLYTGHELYNEEPFASIQFVHIDLENPSAKAAAVETRPSEPAPGTEAETGATTGFVAGQKVRSTRLLDFIDSVGDNHKNELIRRYHLHYMEDAFGRPLLKQVRECWDMASSACFNPTQFTWRVGEFEIPETQRQASIQNFDDLATARAGDLSGNGRQEVVYLFEENNGARFAALVNQDPTTGQLGLEVNGSASPGCNIDAENIGVPTLIDLEGNGYQGLIYAAADCHDPSQNGIYYHVWDHDMGRLGAAGPPVAPLPQGINFETAELTAFDLDGDGLADLVLVDRGSGFSNPDSAAWVYRNFSQGGDIDLSGPLSIGGLSGDFGPTPLPGPGDPECPWIVYYDSFRLLDVPIAEVDMSGRAALAGRYTRDRRCFADQLLIDEVPERVSLDEIDDMGTRDSSYPQSRTFIYQLHDDGGINASVWTQIFHDHLRQNDIVIPADLNSDGYTDLIVLRKNGGNRDVYIHMNDGHGLLSGQFQFSINDDLDGLARVFDYTGNGFPDFLVPSHFNSASARWRIYRWQPGPNGTGGFSSVPEDGPLAGRASQGSLNVFADLYGNGITDLVSFFPRGNWNNCNLGNNRRYCVYASTGLSSEPSFDIGTSKYIATNRIGLITDGLGAWTRIEYKSLAQRSVYTRDNLGPIGYGDGSVVYDVVLPMYVVSAAESLAPRVDGGNTTRVEYYYIGAKLQGGGRGMLGFREVASYDVSSNILTRTGYRQDFPFIGLPAFTQSSYQPDDPWPQVDDLESAGWCDDHEHLDPIIPGPEPMGSDPGTGADCMPESINPSQFELGRAKNTWAELTTDTRHPYLSESEEWSYTPLSDTDGTFLGRAFTHRVLTKINNLDAWGNPGEVAVSTYTSQGEGSTDDLVARQTTVNQYDSTQLHLGRLTCAAVTSERPEQATQARISTFGYDTATGILDRETIGASHCGDTAGRLTTTYDLDNFGNREETRITGDGIDRSSLRLYDSKGRFVNTRRVWIDGGWQTTQTVHQRDRYGSPTRVTDGRGLVTWHYYDHMGRPHYTYAENGAWSRVLYSSSSGSECPANTAYKEIRTGPGNHAPGSRSETQICRDVLGRETRTRTLGLQAGIWNQADTRYDYASRVAWVSEPYMRPCDPDEQFCEVLWNETTYDIAGQVLRVLHADGSEATWQYAGLTTEHTNNPGGSVHTVTANPLGEKVLEIAPDGGQTEYFYDALGQLVETDGPLSGDAITIGYDDLGHKLWMNDPDKGFWEYRHNALGELTCQKDAKGQGVGMIYDDLGRLIERRDFYALANLDTCTGAVAGISEWTYGNVSGQGRFGQVTEEKSDFNDNGDEMIDPIIIVPQGQAPGPSRAFERDYQYDNFGRNTRVTTRIADDGMTRTYIEETTYDEFSRVFQQFDASGGWRGIRYHYNARGYTSRLQEARYGSQGRMYWFAQAQDARGNVTKATLGNGIIARAAHDPATGRLLNLRTEGDVAGFLVAQDLELFWDEMGNLTERRDHSHAAATLSEAFEYDSRDRLEEVHHQVGFAPWDVYQQLRYDLSGSILCKSDVSAIDCGPNEVNYFYDTTRPHAVTQAGNRFFQYDSNGNVVSDSQSDGQNRDYSYTTFNRLRRVTSGGHNTDFFYGPNREKVLKHDAEGRTHYVGNVEIVWPNSGTETYRRYIGGVALVTLYQQSGTIVEEQRYLHKDHLGSVTAITDHNRNIVARMAYDAWGQRRDPLDLDQPWQQWTQLKPPDWDPLADAMLDHTPRGYTGHEQVDDHGIIHMGGRIYDPHLGRFLQADPFVEDSTTLNRYTYVHNNPLSAYDPSGYWTKFLPHNIAKRSGRSIARAIGPEATSVIAGVGCGVLGAATYDTAGAACSAAANYEMTRAFGGSQSDAFRSAAIAGASSAAFYGVGQGTASLVRSGTLTSGQAFAISAVAHGVIGGVSAELQGGKFGHGFASAGLTKVASPAITNVPGGVPAQIAAAAIVGGTVSSITGGKFANGAATAAMAYAFNQLASELSQRYGAERGWYHEYGSMDEGGFALCTAAQEWCAQQRGYESLRHYAYPGQDPASPVVDGRQYTVYGPLNMEVGDITVRLSPETYSVFNVTVEGHWFHDGYVQRGVVWEGDTLMLRTHGVGNNQGFVSWSANNALWRPGFNQYNYQIRQHMTQSWLREQRP